MPIAPEPLPPLAPDRPYDALCVGLNACDHLCLVDGFPCRGGKTRIIEKITAGGGQAATAACALARLGHRTAYAGVCGDDETGLRARPWLEGFGVHPRGLISIPGAGSQEAFIMVEAASGERTIVWHRDPACTLKPAHLDPELIASCKVLHLDGHFLEASLEAARLARAGGAIVSLDGEKVYPGTEKLVALCHVVVGCEDFAQRLTGIDEPRDALRKMAALGPLWAGRTMGPGGAELWAGGEYHRQAAYAVAAKDTTGAGDVFHAGLVHAILEGQPPGRALATSCALAAISVTGLGGRSALPDRQGLREFMSSKGLREESAGPPAAK